MRWNQQYDCSCNCLIMVDFGVYFIIFIMVLRIKHNSIEDHRWKMFFRAIRVWAKRWTAIGKPLRIMICLHCAIHLDIAPKSFERHQQVITVIISDPNRFISLALRFRDRFAVKVWLNKVQLLVLVIELCEKANVTHWMVTIYHKKNIV